MFNVAFPYWFLEVKPVKSDIDYVVGIHFGIIPAYSVSLLIKLALVERAHTHGQADGQ